MTAGYPDWMRAFLLLGKHDSSFLPVLLGPDGSLYCVLQGEYEGALRTVHLDDEGRISAFVVDELDAWGQMLQVGNAELAARLGSPISYDRRGQVLFTERFDHGLSMWSYDYDGAGAGVSLSPEFYTSGGYSLKLIAGTDVAGFASVDYIRGLFPGARAGLGLYFSVLGNPSAVDVFLGRYDGTNHDQAAMRYVVSTSTIKLLTTGSVWTTLTSEAPIIAGVAIFNYFKLVADIGSGYYVRVMLNEYEYNASAIPILRAPAGLAPSASLHIEVTSGGGATSGIYVDDVALTTQEP